jgi:predicted N-formylglutamate amidohydrolase
MTRQFQPCEVIGSNNSKQSGAALVFVVDHASNFIPEEYQNLGLGLDVLNSHVAIDIGAKQMAQGLVSRLGGTAVMACFSRLLIDPNRELWRENIIPDVSDGILIAGNQNLTDAEKQARLDKFYTPFHEAVEAEIKNLLDQGLRPFVIGVHSFTPEMNGKKRPWHIGFMWNGDARLGLALANKFEEQGKVVGHNLPYGGDDLFHTMMSHGFAHGLPHTQIEVRQDLIGNKKDADHWAGLIATALKPFVESPVVLDK